jgi:hypothetical protein
MSEDFDFSKAKTTIAKGDEIPQFGNRTPAVNPLREQFARSLEKQDENGNGQWLKLVVPGEGKPTDKGGITFGKVAGKALTYLRGAAEDQGYGLGKHLRDNEDGTVTITFRAQPKRKKRTKEEMEAAKQAETEQA